MNEGIGARIAAVRKARGLTQTRLAAEAHVSLSLLTKVETGKAPASPVLVGAVARALRVDVPRITGQPYEAASATSHQIFGPITQLRQLLLAFDDPTPPAVPPRALPAIAGDVGAMSALRRATHFRALAAVLPPLVEELRFAALTYAGAERDQALRLLAQVYYAVECLASGTGYGDLHIMAIERVAWCAQELDDPLLIAAAKWGRSRPLMQSGAYEAGQRLMARARADLEELGADTAALAMAGSLHLREALLDARTGNATAAWDHIAAATELAERTGETDVHDLAFGPSNATMYAVSVGVDLEDGARAVAAAEQHPEPLQAAPELLGCHGIELARAHLLRGDHWAAFSSLQQARRLAPQQVRHHPMSREVVLAVAQGGRGREDLRSFASWLGLQ